MNILDDGLDEMAARAYQGLPLRLAVTGESGVDRDSRGQAGY